MTLPQKKEAVEVMMEIGVSERRACDLVDINRSTKRYESQSKDDSELRQEVREIAFKSKRFGYRRIHAKIKKKGRLVNHKKIYRIYSEEALKLRRKTGKKISEFRGAPAAVPEKPNERWSLDFVSDTLWSGRRFRTLNVIDDCTRECVGIEVDFGLPGMRVTRALDLMV